MNADRHDDQRRDFACREPGCNSVANCGQSDVDLCWYGECRNGHSNIIVPAGCKPGMSQNPRLCETCED